MITSSLCFYPSLDLEATTRFYTEVIGLSLVMNSEGQRIFSCGKGNIGFVDYGDRVAASGHICISFNCESRKAVDAEYGRILKLGHPVRTMPAKHPRFPVYSFFLEDPNGYTVEFQKIDGVCL